jgi:hypothetical protein
MPYDPHKETTYLEVSSKSNKLLLQVLAYRKVEKGARKV